MKHRWIVVAGVAASLLSARARGGVTYTWNSGSSGAYSDGTKWTPAGPPGATDTAVFSDPAAATYTVTVPGGQHADTAQVNGDKLTLDLSGGTFTLDAASPAALAVQNNGSVHSTLTVSNGTLAVPNGGMTLTDASLGSGALFNNVTASLASLTVAANGSLHATGGQVSVPALTMNSQGFVLVDGGGKFTTLLPAGGGGFTYGDATIGDSTFYAQSGGKLVIGGNLVAGVTGTSGYASVFDPGSLLQVGDPLSNHQSDFIIGKSAHAVSYMRSGSHTVVTRDLYVGDLPNSGGLALMGSSTADITRNMLVGADPAIPVPAGSTPAAGYVDHEGGQVTNIGGTLKVFPGGTFVHRTGAVLNVTGGVQNSGTFHGSATVNADFTNSGILKPHSDNGAGGDSHPPTTMTLDGNFTQTVSGHLIETFTKGSSTDVFVVSGGSVALDGFADLTITNGNIVVVGDEFLLLRSTGPLSGNVSISAPGFTFTTLLSPGTGVYAVVQSVPEPAACGVLVIAAAAVGVTRRRRRHCAR